MKAAPLPIFLVLVKLSGLQSTRHEEERNTTILRLFSFQFNLTGVFFGGGGYITVVSKSRTAKIF